MIKKGMFVSHRGMAKCCIDRNAQKNISPKEFWFGETRKQALEDMENNLDVNGCDLCYKNESKRTPSHRNYYSVYDNFPSTDLPTVLDIDFSNFCNLKCVMCNPDRSSQWAKDVGKGIVSMSHQHIDELISISDNLQEITLQGGEATIMPEYEYFFEKLREKDLCKNIKVQVITNLTNTKVRFYELLKDFKEVRISVSVDAHGGANDYIRWPSKFESVSENFKVISEYKNISEIGISNTINILSMFNYGDFLNWSKEIEKICHRYDRVFGVAPMKIYAPLHFSPFIAPKQLKQKFSNDVKEFFTHHNFHNTKTKTELQLMIKRLSMSKENIRELDRLRTTVRQLDTQRNIKITDYIPDFHKYI
jgi:pyruvate-formate lyase-activating enzyme